ncbi:MAG TPA: ABC transporter permease [Bacteroidia bacterium]|nr:ABC transporter permease [Bacteroidia bacterium]
MDFYTAAILQGLGYAAMGLGIYISLRIFNIPDITTDGSYTFGGVITAVSITAGLHPILILVLCLSGGAVAGICSGLIHTRLKVNALLSGILVMTALYSVNLSIMGRSNLPLSDARTIFDLLHFFESSLANQLLVVVIGIVILIAFLNWLLRTDFGISMRATGNSEQMVRANGVNTNTMKIMGLAFANALTAFSGYLLVQYQGFADINMGIGIVISGLAAVMIGEAIAKMSGSRKIVIQIIAVVIGSILFRLILAFTLSMGLNPNYLKLITSLIVLLVVALTRFSKVRS